MPPTLYLIDGHALAYRTYYALTAGGTGANRWVTSSGEPTAGVYGFASVLLRILEQERPDYLMVVFDTGRTFRDDLYSEYKATREKMPDDLASQMSRVRELVDSFNIPRLEVEGYEADDVLGSVAKRVVRDQGLGVKIITGDRDLLQLVDDRILVSLPGRSLSDSKDYFPEDVQADIGVRPDQLVDFKALVGDKSDNIPGIRGVGEKTAVSLLSDYGTLDEIYAHLDEQTPGLRKRLEKGRENAYLSQKLARIVTEIDVNVDLENARSERFDPRQVEQLFRQLEFRSLFSRLTSLIDIYGKSLPDNSRQLSLFPSAEKISAAPHVDGQIHVHIVNTAKVLQELVARLESAEMIAIDTETTSTDQMRAQLVGLSLAMQPGRSYYIPVGHSNADDQLSWANVKEALRGSLTNDRIPKTGHNIKYDYVVLARHGLRMKPISFDTMIAEWLVNPTSRSLGLKNLAWVRLGVKMTEIEALIGKGKNQISMAEVPIPDAAAYAADDAEILLRLLPELRSEMDERHALKLFEEVEMPLVSVLAEMEMTGIALDTDYLDKMSQDLNAQLTAIEERIFGAVGVAFNLNSPQQLSEALFDRLALEPPDRTRRTASGYYSTAASVLESLSGAHAVVDWVLEYRELAKLKSTYVDALPQQVNPATARVHTSYNQTGSVTGRIASSDPNLQNIPIRTEIGRQVRRAFIADLGHKLLSVDYSQVELRIVAHMAQDQAMLEAFRAGRDIHAATAAAIYGVPIAAVDLEQRRHAKAINFGLIYGMSPFGLTRTTALTLAEAEDFVDAYFKRFPGVKRYLDGMRRKATEHGFVETLLGRRRYFPGLKNQRNRNIRMREEREAINAPIQGTAADIMKVAMLETHSALEAAGLSARMLLQVHDEIVLECPDEELQATAALVQEVMQNAYPLDVPLKTEARFGPNWYEMKSLNSGSSP